MVFEVLALAGGFPMEKQQLVRTVWRDTRPKDPMATLENTISLLRNALARISGGLPVISTTSGGYAVNTAVAVIDLHRFDRLVGEASQLAPLAALERLTAAIGLADGVVLEDLTDTAWVLPYRDDYRRSVEVATLEAARVALAAERPEATIEFCHRIHRLSVVPCEEAYELEVSALVRLDRRVDAHLRLGAAESVLRDEFETGLGSGLLALRELLRSVGREPNPVSLPLFARSSAPPGPPRFVGRSAEIARIVAVISQAAAGRSASIAVEGPRGSGKSALLDELARRTLPARTIRLNCRPIERPFPLRAATRLAEVLNCAAGPPIAALAPRDPTELFERLVDLIATSAPVVVLVDDVHFADEASATIIDALTSTGGASGCTVIATGPLALRALDRASQVHLELGPLAEEALNELGLPNGVRLTGGHPAVAAACVQSWRRGGEFTDAEVAMVLARCDEPGPLGRPVLAAIAASETPLTITELAYVAGLWPGAVERTVESAAAAGLLADGPRLRLRDEVTRRTLLNHLGDAWLRPTRARAAAAAKRSREQKARDAVDPCI